MYWFRVDTPLFFLLWLAITLVYSVGGWLLATHVFRLQSKERALVGFGIGLAIYLWLCNLLGRWLDPDTNFIFSAIVVLAIGIIIGYRSTRPFLHWKDLKIWPWILVGLILAWVFFRVSKGSGMFDEYKNLALISTIANGAIPARSYFGQGDLLRYHYGFHILGASMMRLGGMMPWSAFDLSKAILWSYSILLAGLLGERYVRAKWGAVLMGSVVALAGGTRYILLILPSSLLENIGQTITLMGTSIFLKGNFTEALMADWSIDAGPPIEYPFAYLSGISTSFVMAHGGAAILGTMLFGLFLLLLSKVRNIVSCLIVAIILSLWALTAETSYALIFLGLILFVLWKWLRESRKIKNWEVEIKLLIVALSISVLFAFIQGGTITAMLEGFLPVLLFPAENTGAVSVTADQASDFMGFSLRWPPAVLSAHLGNLPILSWRGLLVAILEMGPAILFLPWLTKRIFSPRGESNWWDKVLIFSAWIGIILPIFIVYRSDRDITRLTSFGVSITVYLMFIYLIGEREKVKLIIYNLGVISIALMMFSGLILAGTQLTAAPKTMFSYKYRDYDANLLPQIWGIFPQNSKNFGPVGKGSILTGQLTGGVFAFPPGDERLIWEQLETEPSLDMFLANGFEFVYFDDETDQEFMLDANNSDCVLVIGYSQDSSGEHFTGVYDLRDCYPNK